jgi:hypothetical protein
VTPREIATDLCRAIDEAAVRFAGADEGRTAQRPAPGTWCAREILGHLLDSAVNNHRRFVLGPAPGTTRFDGYDQEWWVASQKYAEVPFRDLATLWVAYNRHLAHVMSTTSDEAAACTALSPDGGERISVGFLMADYVRHLRHHLEQIETRL